MDRVGVDSAVNGLITGITVLVILAEREGLLLHGGAVAERGWAVLIGGGSGAGKSTTTVELLAEGMSFLTDELVELDPVAGTVRGFPRPIGLEGPARSWRPQLRPPWAGDEELHRWPVPPRSLGSILERARWSWSSTSSTPKRRQRHRPARPVGGARSAVLIGFQSRPGDGIDADRAGRTAHRGAVEPRASRRRTASRTCHHGTLAPGAWCPSTLNASWTQRFVASPPTDSPRPSPRAQRRQTRRTAPSTAGYTANGWTVCCCRPRETVRSS